MKNYRKGVAALSLFAVFLFGCAVESQPDDVEQGAEQESPSEEAVGTSSAPMRVMRCFGHRSGDRCMMTCCTWDPRDLSGTYECTTGENRDAGTGDC